MHFQVRSWSSLLKGSKSGYSYAVEHFSHNSTAFSFYLPEQLAKGLSNSIIIGDNQTYLVMLSRWLRPVAQINGQWILCWRASLHGWATRTFHSLCDNKGPTVAILKDTNNNIFGGYTSISWRKWL